MVLQDGKWMQAGGNAFFFLLQLSIFNQALKPSPEYLDCCFLGFALWYFYCCYFRGGM